MTSLEKQVKSSIQERTRGLALSVPVPLQSSAITKDAILALIGDSVSANNNSTVQGFINKLAGELTTAKAGMGNTMQLNALKNTHKQDLKDIYDALVGLTDGSGSAREILDNALKKSEGN